MARISQIMIAIGISNLIANHKMLLNTPTKRLMAKPATTNTMINMKIFKKLFLRCITTPLFLFASTSGYVDVLYYSN